MTELQRVVYKPAMRDIRDISEDDERKVAHEAVLQLRICRGDTESARTATKRYALSLGLGEEVVSKTVLGPPSRSSDLLLN